MTQPPETAYGAREFVYWARRQHLAGDLSIPKRTPRQVLAAITEDQRWTHLKRCLHETTIPLAARAAASLLLLYGLPLSRIIQLQAHDLDHHGQHLFLKLGGHRLQLVPAVAGLLKEQRDHATSVAALEHAVPARTAWLFPGGFPGRPSQTGLYRKLREHAMPHLARARAAALITLAAEIPAPVLADLLGLHIHTAVQWSQQAQHDWASYLNALLRDTLNGDEQAHDRGD